MKNLILTIILILHSNGSLANDTIKIAYFNVPPHIIYDSKNEKLASGAVYDLIEKFIAPKMGVNFEWRDTPSNIPRQLTSLEREAIDASALLIFFISDLYLMCINPIWPPNINILLFNSLRMLHLNLIN